MTAQIFRPKTRNGSGDMYARCTKCGDFPGDAWESRRTQSAAKAQAWADKHNEENHEPADPR
jgi:hypothetical protein